jgi:hypothetical protein
MSGKRPNRYFHRYDHSKGKAAVIAKRQKEADVPKRKESPETWIETIEGAVLRDSGAVLDHLQVRALVKDWNALVVEVK